jgi:anti-sigma-K factor RskA
MTDDRTPTVPGTLAAEFALGLLDGDELREARRRALSDPDFASQVARWRGSLAPLHLEIDEESPPIDLWNRIEAATTGEATTGEAAAIGHRCNGSDSSLPRACYRF